MAGRQAYQSYHTKVPDSKIGTKRTDVFFWKVTRFENCLNFKTHVRLFFKNEPVGFDMVSVYLHFDRGTPGPPTDQTTNWATVSDVLSSWCWHTIVLCIEFMFHLAILQQWKWTQLNEHWTTRVHKALPAKGIHEYFQVCFPNISVQVEFEW